VRAFLEVDADARDARVNHLKFESAGNGNEVGVKLQADGTVFSDNELTKGGRGICLVAASYNDAKRVVIERNRIYDCGPSNSKWDHQIYLVKSRGAVVRWNILSGNAGGWGVHLYTDADNTIVEHNVIDDNRGGVIFAGEGGETSDHNVVRNNAITYSGPRWNVEGSWSGGPEGNGNVAEHNCLYTPGPDGRDGVASEEGFGARRNTVLGGSPYVNRSGGDYHFRADSPCADLVGDVAGKITGVPGPNGDDLLRLTLQPERRTVASAGRLLLSGRVAPRRAGTSRRASEPRLSGASVRLQYRAERGWKTLARRRVRRARYAVRVRLPRARGGEVLRVRAVIPGLARSRTVALQVKR
jgi:hypothetical protein